MEIWSKNLKPEELPEPYKEMAKNIGIENTLKLVDLYQGAAIYFPKIEKVLIKIRDKNIRKEFNGGNYKELAIKYGLTERWIREIVSSNVLDNQISFNDVI